MSLGITEITLIVIVAILLFGEKRIPELARTFGKIAYEFKKAKASLKKEADEIKDAIESEVEHPDEYEPKNG